jgi:predicted permease
LRILFRKDDVEAELSEEVRLHVEMEARELVRQGWKSAAARREAHRRLGGVERTKEWVRDERGGRLLDDLMQDIRFAARLLLKERRFTLAAVTVLALGIGANVAVFTMVNTVFLRGLPFPEPDRIVRIWTISQDARGSRSRPSEPTYERWRDEARSLSDLAAHTAASLSVSDDVVAPERVSAAYVSANLFRLLGQPPLVGRDFADEDDLRGASPVVVIGHRLWRDRYASDPSVIGRTLRTNGQTATIIGVMPPDMRFPGKVDLWLPRAQLPRRAGLRSTRLFDVIGRLADEVTLDQARAELATISVGLAEAFPETNANRTSYLQPYYEWTVDEEQIGMFFLLLQAVVPFVLLIACANVANLMLARSARRAREVAVRVSLGAGRGRVVRQLLVESVLLAVVAGVAGLGVAAAGLRWTEMVTRNMDDIPHWMTFTMDGTVFVFVAMVCLATGILFGVVPAVQASKTDVHQVLKDGGQSDIGGRQGRRWTGALIVGEVALTLVLLASAGFLVRSYLTLEGTNLGFDTSPLLTMQLSPALARYPELAQRRAFFQQVEEHLSSISAIDSVAVSNRPPIGYGNPYWLERDGRPMPAELDRLTVLRLFVSDGYFDALGVSLVRGRSFSPADGRPGQQTAVVNQRFVATYFPDQDPIGRRVRLVSQDGPLALDREWLTIVGVSPDIRQRLLQDPAPDLVIYQPHRLSASTLGVLMVRTRDEPAAVTAFVRDAVRAVDAELPVYNVQTMDQRLGEELWRYRVFGSMFAVFAAIALVLSAVGLYAVTMYSVSRRAPELGLRVALGARPRQVQWLVLGQALRHVVLGALVGLGGVLVIGQFFQRVPAFFDSPPLPVASPADPVTLVLVVLVLALAAALACLWPLRLAAHVDPLVALRMD